MDDRDGQTVGEVPGDARAQLDAILRQPMLGIAFWHLDGSITHANDTFLEITGYSRDDLTSGRLNWQVITPPEHRGRDAAALAQLAATGVCQPYEKDNIRKDGRRVHLLAAGAATAPGEGIAFLLDITARVRAERALSQRERELAEAHRLAQIGTWRWDRATDQLAFSDELYRIYGRAPGEVALDVAGFLELVHPDDRQRIADAIQQDLAHPHAVTQSFRTRRPDGTVRYLTSTSHPIVDGDRFVGLTGVLQDVTERTLAEEALRRSEERFRSLLERLAVGVTVCDRQARIVLANPAAVLASGADPAELIGRSALDPAWNAVHDDGTPFSPDEQPVAVAIRTRVAVRNAVLGVDSGGGARVWLLINAEPQLDAAGEVETVVVSFMDITERREMQARLALADRMVSVGTLAAGVAHEINNPLSYVIANLGYVAHELERRATDLPGFTAIAASIAEAREGAERVRNIVRDLRTFSHGDDDRRGPVDVKRVIDSAISLVWNQIRHAARLELEVGALPLVHANESRLAQVFVNLLVNAAQAIAPGDSDANEIRVTGSVTADGRVLLEIADTGSGIPHEDLKRVFDPFFTTRPVGMGTGLGLSICQGIVAELGGEITVESQVGKGSTFRVFLPALDSVRIAPERSGPEASGATRARVLVIDDEPAIGKAIVRMLEDEHDVTFVNGGRQALELLAADAQWDAVLCDLLMPHMTGMELHARLEEAHPRLAAKTVFLTGGAFTPAARAFLERTPNRVMEKPFDFDRLRALVAVVVKGE